MNDNDIWTSRAVSRELVRQERERRKDPRAVWGIPWGFAGLDRLTGGIQPHEMTILMARPGVGKSSLMGQIALSVAEYARRHAPDAVVRLVLCEMTAPTFQQRLACYAADVSVRRVREGRITDAEARRYEAALQRIAELPIEYLDSPTSLNATVAWLRSGGNCLWWAVDYIGIHPLRADTGQMTTTAVVAALSAGFRNAAKEVAPGLVLAQMNRNVEGREDKRPVLSDLKDSGQLEADASNVFALHRDDIYVHDDGTDPSRPRSADLFVLKQRSGPLGRVELLFMPNRMEFVDVSKHVSDLEDAEAGRRVA